MRQILKYELSHDPVLEIQSQASFRHFGMQNEKFFVWFDCLVPSTKLKWEFRIFGTGVPVPQNFQWLGTLIDGGGFAWHLHERIFLND